MKKLFCLLMCLMSIGAHTIAHAQSDKFKVAIYTTNKLSDADRQVINSSVISNLIRSDRYIALERTDTFLNAIQNEHDYQLSGDVSDNQITRIGAKHGADYVAVFNTVKAEDGYCLMSAKLINVETGEIIRSVSSNRTIKSTPDLIALTNNVAYKLFCQN